MQEEQFYWLNDVREMVSELLEFVGNWKLPII